MKIKPSKRSRQKTKQDIEWSIAVKARDDYGCRWCGRLNTDIQAAHIIKRENLKTRYLLENGLCLCNISGCRTHWMEHSGNTHQRLEARERILKIVGGKEYERLWEIAHKS